MSVKIYDGDAAAADEYDRSGVLAENGTLRNLEIKMQ